VVLDEVQLVETGISQAAVMAAKLPATHRWCVSGTPLGNGRTALDDFRGLLQFMQVSPLHTKKWWRHAIQIPVGKGHAHCKSIVQGMLQELMWRSSKSDKRIRDQLQIPEQRQVDHVIPLSSIERYHYKKNFEACVAAVNQAINRFEQDPFTSSACDLVQQLAPQILRLRQACCHPQLEDSRSLSSKVLSMEELVKKMVDKEHNQCMEYQRILLMEMGGLGHILRMNSQHILSTIPERNEPMNPAERSKMGQAHAQLKRALQFYELGLSVINHHNEIGLHADQVQILHLKHSILNSTPPASSVSNVAAPFEDLSSGDDTVTVLMENIHKDMGLTAKGPSDSVDRNMESLRKNVQEMETNHLMTKQAAWTEVRWALDSATPEPLQLQAALAGKNNCVWWDNALQWVEARGDAFQDLFLEKIKSSCTAVRNHARSITALRFFIQENVDRLLDKRLTLLLEVDGLSKTPPERELLVNGNCGNCRKDWDRSGETCDHCHLEKKIESYGGLLFNKPWWSHGAINTTSKQDLEPTWVRVLRFVGEWVISQSAQNGDLRGNRSSAESVFKVFHELRDGEFKAIRKMWQNHFDLLSTIDELKSSMNTLRLVRSDENVAEMTDHESRAVVHPSELPQKQMEHITKLAAALADLKAGKVNLSFLKQQAANVSKPSSKEDKECFVCREPFDRACCDNATHAEDKSTIDATHNVALFPCGAPYPLPPFILLHTPSLILYPPPNSIPPAPSPLAHKCCAPCAHKLVNKSLDNYTRCLPNKISFFKAKFSTHPSRLKK
jgi:hypothetical protein